MPTLIHEGRAIIESTLICEYLDETFPEPSLVPDTAYGRYSQMRRWSKHIDEGVFEATREISFLGDVSRQNEWHDPGATGRPLPQYWRPRTKGPDDVDL